MSNPFSIQVHGPGPACDTIATSCVPIIFVPGVMGSRIKMAKAGRAWDPDTWQTMLGWVPLFEPNRRTNRRALSVKKTDAVMFTTLGAEALHAIAINAGLTWIYGLDTGTTPMALPANPGAGFDPAAFEAGWAAQIGGYYGEKRKWSSVLWKFYGSFLMLLETQLNGDLRHPVFAFGYDWRKSCTETGNDLATFIADTINACEGARDAIVVTHSMGGLVLRAALKSGELQPKVRGVVHGAQPSNGAVVCLRRFFTGSVSALDGRDRQAFFLNNVMGNTPERFAYNLSDCPGPVQLLPNNAYQQFAVGEAPWLSVAGRSLNLSDLYAEYGKTEWPGLVGPAMSAQDHVASDQERRSGEIVMDMNQVLTVAKAFHESVAGVAHPNTLVVYSTGLPTDVRLEFDAYTPPAPSPDLQSEPLSGYVYDANPGALSPPAWRSPYYGLNAASGNGPGLIVHREDAGDGTVPAVSAMCPGLTLARPAESVGAIPHADVYSAAEFQAAALKMIRMLLAVSPGTKLTP